MFRLFPDQIRFQILNSFPCYVFHDGSYSSSYVSLLSPFSNPRITGVFCSIEGYVGLDSGSLIPITNHADLSFNYPFFSITDGITEIYLKVETYEVLIDFLNLYYKRYNEYFKYKIDNEMVYSSFYVNSGINGIIPNKAERTSFIPFQKRFRISDGLVFSDPICIAMMLEKESYFRSYKSMNIMVVTWNIDEKSPPSSIESLVAGKIFDIIVFSFQEIDMCAESIIFGNTSKKDTWVHFLMSSTDSLRSFAIIESVQLGTCFQIVFVRDRLVPLIKNISKSSLSLGSIGFYNKSAVGIRFEIEETPICFVCSHFDQSIKNVDRRNAQFHRIINEMLFDVNKTEVHIEDHDEIIWSGDLNYRLSIPDTESRLHFNDSDYLFPYDQLTKEMAQNKVFQGYFEAPITFCQSYKYNKGNNSMDTSKKMRGPAWCDRILMKYQGSNSLISCKEYNICLDLTISDHRPVYGIFECKYWITDHTKIHEQYHEVRSLMNSLTLSAKISKNHINFGHVKRGNAATQTISLKNDGSLPILFTLNTKCVWVDIYPHHGIVYTGKTIFISFNMKDRSMKRLNTLQTPNVFDIVTVNFQGSLSPLLITLLAEVELDSFELPIEYLTRMWKPLYSFDPRSFQPSVPFQFSTAPIAKGQSLYDVPFELWILCDELLAIVKDPNVFFENGNINEIHSIMDHLRDRSPLSRQFSEHSIADSIILFLSSLPEPVIPSTNVLLLKKKGSDFNSVISSLKAERVKIVYYLIGFIHYLYHHVWINMFDFKKPANLFGKALVNHKELERNECYSLWIEKFWFTLENDSFGHETRY